MDTSMNFKGLVILSEAKELLPDWGTGCKQKKILRFARNDPGFGER